jgi:molybdopterin converting factor small subunit
MAKVWIPALLRQYTNGQAEVQAEGATVGELIAHLEQRYPGLARRLIEPDQQRLRPHLMLVVNGEHSRQGLRHPVDEDSEIHFVPAMSGG